MGLYRRFIVPPLVELAMRQRTLHPVRERVVGAAAGRVLEIGAGSGMNLALYGPLTRYLVALEPSPQLLCRARRRAATAAAPVELVEGSAEALPLADASVDLIVSFETIEHLDGQEVMLAEFRRVLAGAGVLIISSPNKAIYSEETGYVNEFHVRELTRDELAAMLGAHFPQQTWYGQRVLAHSMLWQEQRSLPPTAELVALSDDRVEALPAPAPPMYFVVVCGAENASLPKLASLSVFDDGAQSLYRDYQRAQLAEKRLYWDEIDARRIAEARLAELVAAVNNLNEARKRIDGLQDELGRTRQSCAQLASTLGETQARLGFRETWRGWLRWPLGRARLRLRGNRP